MQYVRSADLVIIFCSKINVVSRKSVLPQKRILRHKIEFCLTKLNYMSQNSILFHKIQLHTL